jgi:hypothetical protein
LRTQINTDEHGLCQKTEKNDDSQDDVGQSRYNNGFEDLSG